MVHSILFVCMGNICRSPAAEGIMKTLLQKESLAPIHVESCGIGDWHLGHSPDLRMIEAAKLRGVFLDSRAKQFIISQYDQFDLILAVDEEVLNLLLNHTRKKEQKIKIKLITAFSDHFKNQNIPDPYQLNEKGFERVLDILEDSCKGLINQLKTNNRCQKKESI